MNIIEKAAQRLKQPVPGSLVEKAAQRLTSDGADQDVAAARDEAPPAAGAGAEPGETTDAPRRSRRATIDFDRLSAVGMLTPFGKRTRLAEEFRVIKRPLLRKAFARGAGAIENGHLIMVTSAGPQEGKTFTAVNLAISIASERDLTVLLVDADFARPGVMRTLGLRSDKGLSDVLDDGDLDLSDVLIRTNLENLAILPPGRADPFATEMLASERMGRLIQEIAERYSDRVIIFDSPPILASSEPAVLAMYMGQILFVVEAERTSQVAVREALGMIDSCSNIGLVLNKARSRLGAELFGSYYDYARD